jgi:hypothetical protein
MSTHPPKVARQRSVEQVFPKTSSTTKEEGYEKFIGQGKGLSSFQNKEKEDKSLYEQLRQQRNKDEDSDWDETSGSIRAPAVLEDEDVEFLEQLKKKKDESFRSLDEQVEKFKERRHNLVLVTAEEEPSTKPPQETKDNPTSTSSAPAAEKRKLSRLPSYLKAKEKRSKVEAPQSCTIPSLIPYVDDEASEDESQA